jgi:hypothetical protein
LSANTSGNQTERFRHTALKLRKFWRSMHRLSAGDHDLISIVAPRA